MSRISVFGALASLVCCQFPLPAEQFKLSLGRGDSVKVRAINLPQVRVGAATLAIDVKDGSAASNTLDPAQPAMPAPVTQLQAALDQLFRNQFTLVQSNGGALLRISITHFTAPQSNIVPVKQKVRTAAPPSADGSPQIDPSTGQPASIVREVDVEQWQGRGQMSVRAELVDASGVLLDGFTSQTQVNSNAVISVDGQDRVDRTQIPSREQILDKLINDVAVQFQPRYAPAVTEEEIPLAVDEELRPGNKLAKEGNLAGASESWKAAQMKKPEAAGDRTHNIGAAYEIQAYEKLAKQEEPVKVLPYLQEAAKQYQQAHDEDPKEKYITQAQQRVQKVQALVTRLQELEAKRQAALTARAQPSPWPPASGAAMPGYAVTNPAQQNPSIPFPQPDPNSQTAAPGTNIPTGQSVFGQSQLSPTAPTAPATVQPAAPDPVAEEALQTALNDPRPDNEKEKQFRQLVRLRFAASPAAPAPELRQQVEALGAQAYGLTALQARRVVHQEAQAFSPNRAAYRDAFAAFAQDSKISPEERTVLKTLAQNLNLTAADVSAVESAFTVSQ